ncbi:MAG: hypothetical protein P8Y75_01075 [Nitrospirota bacterium]
MLTLAAFLFALAALGGATLAYLHMSGKHVPVVLALGHGVVAASGLVLFIVGLAQVQAGGLAIFSLILFVLAAFGGLTLFSAHLKKRKLPVGLIFLHAGAALTAFVLLLISLALGSTP